MSGDIKELMTLVVFCCVIIVIVSSVISVQEVKGQTQSYEFQGWECINNECQKSHNNVSVTLSTCIILCQDAPPLWPKPKEIVVRQKDSTTFLKEHIFLEIHSPEEIKPDLEQATNIFFNNLVPDDDFQLHNDEEQIVKLTLHVQNTSTILGASVNESYILYSQKLPDKVMVNIYADNYFGARHGLETLSQLIWYDSHSKRFRIYHDIKVTDAPSFGHRGLLIDVSRHFFPIELLKKSVEGMAASKLNVLHLHVSDITSFPIILPHNQQFALEGSYSYESKYTPEEVKDLVEFARKRGIRIIMEVDAPSHVTPNSWPKDEILCDSPDIFKATLNPDNPHTLDSLQSIYEDLLELGTDADTFHIGDDEVLTACWKETDAARQEQNNLYAVWINFTNQMVDRVKKANKNTLPKNVVLWSSPLTDKYITSLKNPDSLVVQFWFGQFNQILEKGFKIIFSTVGNWYLDCGFGPWKKNDYNGACDPYTDWRKFYKYRPWKDYSNRMHQVLGGEVCLWSEQVSSDDLETRLWPRTAAFAERVWSDPEIFDTNDVFRRIDFHSTRLQLRGFRVAAIWPELCSQYPQKC